MMVVNYDVISVIVDILKIECVYLLVFDFVSVIGRKFDIVMSVFVSIGNVVLVYVNVVVCVWL